MLGILEVKPTERGLLGIFGEKIQTAAPKDFFTHFLQILLKNHFVSK